MNEASGASEAAPQENTRVTDRSQDSQTAAEYASRQNFCICLIFLVADIFRPDLSTLSFNLRPTLERYSHM